MYQSKSFDTLPVVIDDLLDAYDSFLRMNQNLNEIPM